MAALASAGCTSEQDDTADYSASAQSVASSEASGGSDSAATTLSFRPVLATIDSLEPGDGGVSRPGWVDKDAWKRLSDFDCTSDTDQPPNGMDPSTDPDVACDTEEDKRHLLGASALDASDVEKATAEKPEGEGQWVINLSLTTEGSKALEKLTKKATSRDDGDPRQRFAIMADQDLLVAPISQAVITDGNAKISGDLTEQSARAIADDINAASD